MYIYFPIFISCLLWSLSVPSFIGEFPTLCDPVKATKCEHDYLICKQFDGPANDPETTCYCGSIFYGECINDAQCLTSRELKSLSNHDIYMKTCVNSIIRNDCSSVLPCAINCASDGIINAKLSKIIPFNNFGQYYLRIRICQNKVHLEKLKRYSTINMATCNRIKDFVSCSKWIPPMTYVPVALPINTTYIEVDSCVIDSHGTRCLETPGIVRVYGSEYLFPSSFDVPHTNMSICSSDDDCLGSFCDFHQRPPLCSPKSIRQISQSGKYYFSDPFD